MRKKEVSLQQHRLLEVINDFLLKEGEISEIEYKKMKTYILSFAVK